MASGKLNSLSIEHAHRSGGPVLLSCLGHKLRGVEGTYNTHDYLNERRAALEAWTALLLDIESGAQTVSNLTFA